MLARFIAFLVGLAGALPCTPACAEEPSRGLLWEVSSPTTTVYLLGTIHVGSRDLYPLPAAVEEAYRRATVLAVEADMTNATALSGATATFLYQPPDNLERHVPPALFQDVGAALRRYGLPHEMGSGMKPYMLAMALTMFEAGRMGLDATQGLDLQLTQRAHRDGKRVVELESVALQMDMLDSMPEAAQVAMLESTVRGVQDGSLGRDLASLIDAWKRGHADRLDEVAMHDLQRMPMEAGRAVKTRIFDERNRGMVRRIVDMLAGRDVVLVAVGAGHFTGPDGIVELLRARGLVARQR